MGGLRSRPHARAHVCVTVCVRVYRDKDGAHDDSSHKGSKVDDIADSDKDGHARRVPHGRKSGLAQDEGSQEQEHGDQQRLPPPRPRDDARHTHPPAA